MSLSIDWDLGKTRNATNQTPAIIQKPKSMNLQNPYERGITRKERVIRLGKIPVPEFPIGHHWSLKIGDKWWEIYGDGTKDPNNNVVEFHYDVYVTQGAEAHSGIDSTGSKRVGTTYWTDEQIYSWSRKWIENHPVYNFFTTNCQMFATDLANAATDGNCDMPPMQSSDGAVRIKRPDILAHNADGEAEFGIQGVEVDAQFGPGRAAAAAPTAKVGAMDGKNGNFGAFVEADLGKVEVDAGPVKARVRPNIDTGFSKRGDNVEANVLGFGFKGGKDGVGLKTPLFEINLGSFW